MAQGRYQNPHGMMAASLLHPGQTSLLGEDLLGSVRSLVPDFDGTLVAEARLKKWLQFRLECCTVAVGERWFEFAVRSEDAYFGSDSVGLPCITRVAFAYLHAAAIQKVTLTTPV